MCQNSTNSPISQVYCQALGTHAGIVHILDLTGKRIKSYKPHLASIVDIEFDETGDFIATASIDGKGSFYTYNPISC